MEILIEDNAVSVQKQSTHIIVEQKVISSQKGVDEFLDEINDLKRQMVDLSNNLEHFIDSAIQHVNAKENKETYIFVRELIVPVFQTIDRLVNTINESSEKIRECYVDFIEPFQVLLSDMQEIMDDLQYKIDGDKEMEALLS